MHRGLAVPVPTSRLWVHCPRASDGLLPPRLYLVGYVRWDARSSHSSLLDNHVQQLTDRPVPNLYRTSHRPRSSPVRPDLWNQPNIPEMDPSLDPSQLTLGRSAT